MHRRRSSSRSSRLEQLENRWLLAAIPVSAEEIAFARELGYSNSQIQQLTHPVSMTVSKIKAKSDLFNPLSSIPARANSVNELFPKAGVAFKVDWADLKPTLAGAPMEFSGQKFQVSLPRPDGTFERFNVFKTQVLAPELAAQFPEIQTYIGQSIDRPGSTLAMDYTVHGLHASIYSPNGSWYIDPFYKQDADVHVSYFRKDLQQTIKHLWKEQTNGDLNDLPQEEESVQTVSGTGPTLRTYDMAITATAEYTNATGGTQQSALSAITTNVSRLNQVYERDFAIRFQLVADELDVIFTSATDPFGNPGDAGTTASQNQSVTDSRITNYDIGHVFHRVTSSFNANGIAQLESVGKAGQKAIGYSCHSLTTGDFFTIDFVAHEMGHQFGGRHSFNSARGGAGDSTSIAVETGAGLTIMGYAGLGTSSENVADHSDAMFHAVNMSTTTASAPSQILSYTTVTSSAGYTSATKTASGNFAPVANAGANYVIPSRTPFILTATATDSNDASALTYSWEQLNGGNAVPMGTVSGVPCVPNPNPATEVTYGPAFRTFLPTSSPSRMFPALAAVRLGRTFSRGENVPTKARTMNFTVVVRDNFAGSGGTSLDGMTVTTVNTGTGFAVTNLNSNTTLDGNASQLLTWDVAGTTANGINAASVNIYLSTDNGASFGTLLVGNVPNDGSETITIPNIDTNAGRIIIQPTNNIFFDMNNGVLTIQQSTAISVVPTSPDLDAISDTGSSSIDNLTRFNNSSPSSVLSLTVGSTVPGALIEILFGATVIGSATASGTSTTVTTNGTLALPEGPVSLTARQTEPGKTASTSASSLNITVDTIRPTTSASFDREETQDVTLSYSEDISASLIAGDFTLTNLTTTQQIPVTSFAAGAATATLGFTGILPNGHYQLDLASANASDMAGNTLNTSLNFTFDVLAGDANGDGTVSFNDLLVVAQNYDGPGTLFSQGDFNYDDNIDFNDLLICAQNYNISLARSNPFGSTTIGRQSAAAGIGLSSASRSRASDDGYNRSVIA